MALDEPQENEQPVQVNGIGVLIADSVEPWINGATVDYVKNWYKEGFSIIGSQASC